MASEEEPANFTAAVDENEEEEDYDDEAEYEGEDAEEEVDDDDAAAPDDDDAAEKAASWMSGKWGISWRHWAGDNDVVRNFNVKRLVKQVLSLPGASYVLLGLSAGAKGAKYIAPHSVLSEINPGSCPERDLFDEIATAFQAKGYKVLVYMATEGPAQLHHGPDDKRAEKFIENWKSYVKEKYGSDDVETLKKAYAEVIVKEYAERYGSKIDGWWFDHASFGNIPLLREVCKEANPGTILAFNKGGVGKVRNNNPGYEDYTKGHPTPMRRCKASDRQNLPMVRAIEKSSNGFLYARGKASLGHMFMPMMERWNSGGSVVWEEDQAVDWMSRVLDAGGTWTWNVPLVNKESRLNVSCVKFASRVGERLAERHGGGGGDDEL